MIKVLKCRLCKESKGEEYIGTRKGLRKHLREKHKIMSQITNSGYNKGYTKQSWWKEKKDETKS